MRVRSTSLFQTICLIVFFAGCDSSLTPPAIQGIFTPSEFTQAKFPSRIDSPNPYFPLIPGLSKKLVGNTPEGEEIVLREVTDRKRAIVRVRSTIVRVRVWLEGVLTEDTEEFYAQDSNGNVWSFGEESKLEENGDPIEKDDSWEAGRDGARAGVMMWARPKLGSVYYQEYYPGRAEEVAEVKSLNETVVVPYGTFDHCILTQDTSRLEPESLEYKYYCPGIGHVLTVDVTEYGVRYELADLFQN